MAAKKRSRLEQFFIRANRALRDRSDSYLSRRPHRSFRRTRRRDYVRSFKLPGYIALTRQTFAVLLKDWRLFGLFFLFYAAASLIVIGLASQENYNAVVNAFKQANASVWLQTLSIFGSAITGGLGTASASNNGITTGLVVVIGWLTMVWLLRHKVAGVPTKLRSGLYNACAPLIPTVAIVLVGLVQTIPIVLVNIGYNAANGTGLLNNGIEAMLFFAVAALLIVMSLYWLTSTFIALIVVTLPGMYPVAALRASGDLIIGRRSRLLLRLLWLILLILLMWALVLIPIIMLDSWLNVAWLPLVPVSVLLLSTATLIISSTYIYLLYRKLVDDEAKPA